MTDKFYGKDFKEAVIACLVRDKGFLQEAFSILRPTHFDEQLHSLAVEIIFAIYQRDGVLPSRIALTNELINKLMRDNRTKTDDHIEKLAIKPAQEFLERIYSLQGEMKDIQKEFLEYYRSKELENKLLELYEGVRTGEILSGQVIDEVRKVYSKSSETQDAGMDFLTSLEDARADFQTDAAKRAVTGFRSLDLAMDGGPTTGTLTTFIAPPKGGKSMSLVNTAMANLQRGKTVFHFTLEISAKKIRRRFLSRISGIPMRDLKDNLDTSFQRCQSWWKTAKGKLFIKEFMSSGVTVDDFRSYIYSMQAKGIKPDILIIDYGDLVRSANKKSDADERHIQGASYFEMRQLQSEFDTVGFTASQGNRESLNKEKIRMDLIAESWAKAMHSDHLVSVCQTETDAASNRARLFFCGSREGGSGIVIPIAVDWSKCLMIEMHHKQAQELAPEINENGQKVDADWAVAQPEPKKEYAW